MSGFDWDKIQECTGGRWVVKPTSGNSIPVGASIDTRELSKGQCFVAYVGEHTDGHGYLLDAKNLGASMCVVTDAGRVPEGFLIPVLLVENATDAMTAMAQHWRSMLQATVVGVTGSNGKTTTTRLIQSVLSVKGKAWVSSKSHNNAIGVPLSILNTPLDVDFAVFELGTSSPGEIERRAALVKPDIAVITSIGRAHLEELGSIEGVCQEKASILRHTKDLGIVPLGITPLEAAIKLVHPECEIQHLDPAQLINVEIGERSVSFGFGGHRFIAPVPGVHNAGNAGISVMVGRACSMSDEDIAKGLSVAKLPEMRLDRVEIPTGSDPIVMYNDAYNANPDSTRAALAFFGSLKAGPRKVVVLGDMLELGESGPTEHATMVAELDPGAFDRVVLVGPLYSAARGDASDSIETVASTDNYAMTELARSIKPGDCVLIKGSRGIGLERLVYILLNRHTPQAWRRSTEDEPAS